MLTNLTNLFNVPIPEIKKSLIKNVLTLFLWFVNSCSLSIFRNINSVCIKSIFGESNWELREPNQTEKRTYSESDQIDTQLALVIILFILDPYVCYIFISNDRVSLILLILLKLGIFIFFMVFMLRLFPCAAFY